MKFHVGFGYSPSLGAGSVVAALSESLALNDLSRTGVIDFATLDARASEEMIRAVDLEFSRPLLSYSAKILETLTPRLATPSEELFRTIGCHGVAEAAALASSGPDGRLLVTKRVVGSVTFAAAIV